MTEPVLRIAEEKDNETLYNIIKHVFEEFNAPKEGTVYSDPTTKNLYGLFQKPGSILWVAELNGEMVGLCGIYPTEGLEPGSAELVKFYLVDKARGKGIGKKLILKCFTSAKELGYKSLYLESLPVFSQAITMYESLGFKKLNGPLGNSGHTSCDIWMLKDI